ncbi:hypothetical protein DITRI_Ditri09bG0150700 [Diplodiscus trichospermus]
MPSPAESSALRDSSNVDNGKPNSTLPIFSFLIAVFLTLMSIKFQHVTNESPFQTHTVIMLMFVFTILVYSISLCTSYIPQIISHVSLLSGSLSPILLALILCPNVGRLVLVVWVIYFVKLAYDAYLKLYQLHKTSFSVSEFFNKLLDPHCRHEVTIRDTSSASTARTQRHANLRFLIAVLLALLLVEFQSKKPFETHSTIISTFVMAALVYGLADWVMEAKFQIGNNSYHQIILSKISLLSASLATVLLVLVLVPALGWFTLLVWTLFLFKQIYDAWQKFCQLYQAISFAIDVFNQVLGRVAHQNEQRVSLPF